MTWIRRDAGRSPKKADTSIPSKLARNVGQCSAGTAAETRTSMRAESMKKISCFARNVDATYYLTKDENLEGKRRGCFASA